MKKIFTSLAMIAALAFGASAQRADNDDCITAMELNYVDITYYSPDFDDEATEMSVTTVGRSTASALNFAAVGNTPVADLWFKFTATQATGTIVVKPNSNYYPVIELYSGTCDNLTLLAYSNESAMNGMERLTFGQLVTGETYYIRVYHINEGTASIDGAFKIALLSKDFCDYTTNPLNMGVTVDVATGTFYLTATGGVLPYHNFGWDDEFGYFVASGVYSISGYSIGDRISAVVIDSAGCMKIVQAVMTGPLNAIIGVSEVAAQYNMSVYPNPAHNTATLSLNTAALTDLQIELVNIAGQVIYTESVAQEGAKQYNLPVADLVSGVYFVKVSSKEGIATQKLIIAK